MAQKIVFQPNAPVEVALKFPHGKNVRGFYGEQVLFTATDDRIFYLDPEPASDIETRIRELGIRTGEPFRLTKIKHQRGGGISFRVDRVANETDLERTLTRSIAAQEKRRASVPFREQTPTAIRAPQIEPAAAKDQQEIQPGSDHNAAHNASGISRTGAMVAAMCAAVDAVLETQVYAARKGLGVTFSEESVRAIGLSIYSSACKDGRE